MQVDQALRALAQLKEAAPPTTSARLGDVIKLVRQLQAENVALIQQLATYPLADFVPQAFDMMRVSMDLVSAQSEGLRGGKLGRVTTEQADCLQLIHEHSSSAGSLLETLDVIALLHMDALRVEPLVFSGLDLLAAAWQQHFDDSELREHHITVYADDPLPQVKGDYRQILTILSDLLDNAIRYTPFGGMIRMTAETLGTHVLFSVADNGIGLTPEEMVLMGQPFWRSLRQPLVRQHPGTGLRIYLAQQLLQLHGSELLFSGEPGMGSTFSFALPLG
ncbi:MAG: sensor histidine kinase [Chloroflexota bacterium]